MLSPEGAVRLHERAIEERTLKSWDRLFEAVKEKFTSQKAPYVEKGIFGRKRFYITVEPGSGVMNRIFWDDDVRALKPKDVTYIANQVLLDLRKPDGHWEVVRWTGNRWGSTLVFYLKWRTHAA